MRIFGRRDSADPAATYAAVLDGEHLWWHVPGHDRLLLLALDGSADVEVAVDPFPLTGLAADDFDVLAGGNRVGAASLPARQPSRTPLTIDGRTQYDVTSVDGHLRLTRRTTAPTAVLDAVEVRGWQVHLRITPPEGIVPGVHLVLAAGDPDDAEPLLGLLPLSAHDGHLDGLLGVEDLPAGYFGVLELGVGTVDSWVRVRRGDTGLADPHRAVLLPELVDPRHPDRPRARLRWSADSLLALRCLDAEAAS